ncbi:hypothetical protein BDD12DRAFT_525432 [Trichophaea hybrida]|nr:hypothetical protein BDD12DRAFT_525432 [Trichophaea hybrida]
MDYAFCSLNTSAKHSASMLSPCYDYWIGKKNSSEKYIWHLHNQLRFLRSNWRTYKLDINTMSGQGTGFSSPCNDTVFRNKYHEMCFQLETELRRKCFALVTYQTCQKAKDEFENILKTTLAEGTQYYGYRSATYDLYNQPIYFNFQVLVRFPLRFEMLPEFRRQLTEVKEKCGCVGIRILYTGEQNDFGQAQIENSGSGEKFGEKIVSQELEDLGRLQVLLGIVEREMRPEESWQGKEVGMVD